MYDTWKVGLGLLVFVGLLFFPIWYNAYKGGAGVVLDLEDPVKGYDPRRGKNEGPRSTPAIAVPWEKEKEEKKPEEEKLKCVRETKEMRSQHMDLLNDWRERVVRDGDRYAWNMNDYRLDASLTNSCIDCHPNRDKDGNDSGDFCGRCHDYMGVVKPYCWNCHVEPSMFWPEETE